MYFKIKVIIYKKYSVLLLKIKIHMHEHQQHPIRSIRTCCKVSVSSLKNTLTQISKFTKFYMFYVKALQSIRFMPVLFSFRLCYY
jgi:hypothetical protein